MRQRRFAFTLVEILVVLAILTLLAALLFTVFGRVREGGRGAVCLSNQKQILLSLQLYEGDSAGVSLNIKFFDLGWVDRLLPYAGSNAVFVCPTDTDIETKALLGYFTTLGGVKTPSVPTSYIVNDSLLHGLPNASIQHPATTVFLSDGQRQAFPQAPYWTPDVPGNCASNAGIGGYVLREPSQSTLNPVTPGTYSAHCYAPNTRHNRRANVGFVDGHVKSMDLSTWYFPHTPFLDPKRGG